MYLKQHCGNLFHVARKIYALSLETEAIRLCYLEVDGLIAYAKALFLKSPIRICEFHRQRPDAARTSTADS